MKQEMTEETRAFLKEREDRFGGKIVWRGFSLFYGDNNGNLREHGVFVFQIDNRFYYEDFETTPRFLGLPIFSDKKQKSDYVKFEGSFRAIDVRSIDYVKKSSAIDLIKGRTQKVKTASVLGRLLGEVVMSVEFDDGSIKFFEFAGNEFRQLVEMAITKYKWSKTVYDKENGIK